MKPPHAPTPAILWPRARLLAAALTAAAGLLVLSGCDGGRDAETPSGAAAPPKALAEVAASHVLVAWTGTLDAPAGLQRSREEAEERARRIALLLRTGRADLPDLARRYSDDPAAQRNAGYLGVFDPSDADPMLAAAVCSLQVGEIAGPVESAHGFHVVRREPVRRVRIHHVLVAYTGAVQAGDLDRPRGQALAIARALQRKLADGELAPCDIAERFSDDPQNRHRCGDLGWVEPGMLEPAIEQAVFALEPGQCTAVLESEYGFHVFWRVVP
jgi:peptidyl-prolyl cis-trans isomerase SurA